MTGPLNIVIAAYQFHPGVGGVATTEAALARGFVEEGHDVSVVALNDGPTEGYGHRVYRAPGPLTLFRLYRKADVLIQSNLALKLIYPLLLIRRPYALRHHSESAFRLSRSLLSLDLLRRAAMSHARHFMTSAYIGSQSRFDHYVVTHPFANVQHFTPGTGLDLGDRTGAVFVGRMEPEKGVQWLLERWPAVKAGLGIDTLSLIGVGSLDPAIKAGIAAGRYPGVEHLGPLSGPQTARAMGSAVYSIVPSLWQEPFGAVALESIAAGAITVSSSRGGLMEAGGALGHYYDPDDEQAFLAALNGARAQYESHKADTAARHRYLEAVNAHVETFQPRVAIRKILSEMGRAARC